MNYAKILAATMLLVVPAMAAEPVDLSGTISSRNGGPLPGALVTLLSTGFTTEADADGHYAITSHAMPLMFHPAASPDANLLLRPGESLLSLPDAASVQLGLYDGRGRMVEKILSGNIAAGQHRFSLTTTPGSGIYFVRFALDNHEIVRPWLPGTALALPLPSAPRMRPLARGSAVALDTLRVSAAGHRTAFVPLSSLSGQKDVTLDTLSKNTGSSPVDDGSGERLSRYGEPEYFWGDMGNGDEPMVKITHAVTDQATDVEVLFNPDFVDLTYGDNGVGWGNRTWRHVVTSDHVEVAFVNGDGDTVLHARIDLISKTALVPSGYASLGVTDGDGALYKGDVDDVLSFGTSMDDNINYHGYELFESSPQTDSVFTPNPDYPDWEYHVVYRLSLDPDAFGPSGYGGVHMTSVHASPSKNGPETVEVSKKPGPEAGTPEDPFRFYQPPGGGGGGSGGGGGGGSVPPDTTPVDTTPVDSIPVVD